MSTKSINGWKSVVRSAIAGMPDSVSGRIRLLEDLAVIVPPRARARTLLRRALEGLQQHCKAVRTLARRGYGHAGEPIHPVDAKALAAIRAAKALCHVEGVGERDAILEAALGRLAGIGNPMREGILKIGSGLWGHQLAIRELAPKRSNDPQKARCSVNGRVEVPWQGAIHLN